MDECPLLAQSRHSGICHHSYIPIFLDCNYVAIYTKKHPYTIYIPLIID